jgi:RNA polymerase sigma factor (sigma-70 family)
VIARNCYLLLLRHKGRLSPLEKDVSDPGQATYHLVEQRAELAHVIRDLRQLPEMDRTALLLAAVQGFSYEQIAEALGLSLGAVKTKIYRARLKLVQARKQRR